jgi:tetratricopeptide (TPR) repeat protein
MADSQRIDDLRRRVQKDPASIAFAQLAEELRRAGDFEESVDTCRTGLAIHPTYLSARVTLGRALIELNQLGDAQRELELVLKSAPENLAAIRGLGEIHHRNGDLAAALAQYRTALALARNDPDLEDTVAQLARQVEPAGPAAPDETLSLDQMEDELLKLAPPPTGASAPQAPPPPASSATALTWPTEPEASEPAEPPESDDPLELAPPMEEPVPSEAELEHAVRTVAALEQWLDAIHVARADRRA